MALFKCLDFIKIPPVILHTGMLSVHLPQQEKQIFIRFPDYSFCISLSLLSLTFPIFRKSKNNFCRIEISCAVIIQKI